MQASYATKVGGALSRLLNAAFLGGHPSESISACTHREWVINPDRKWIRIRRKLINALFFWQEDHCQFAYDFDMAWAWDRIRRYPDQARTLFCVMPPEIEDK